MITFRRSTGSTAAIATILLLAAHSVSIADKMDWKAEGLASPFPKPQTEQQLIEQLRTAPPEGKAVACKQLSIYGGKSAVPELAKLLSEKELASWARIALEAIPDSSADAALVEASKSFEKTIPGLVKVSAGTSLPSTRPVVDSSYDVGIVMSFRDEASLRAFEHHPVHMQAVEKTLKPLVARFVVYDFVDDD